MKLPRIFEHFKQGQIFTIDEAREKLGTTGNTLRKRLSELSARNYIFPIRQGLYRVSRIGERPDRHQSSPFAIASKLTPYCYVGFKSALQLHAGEIPFENDTVFVVSPTKFNSFKFESRSYFWCQSPESHGLETHVLYDYDIEFSILVTTFEKSIVDCLKRPAHCPTLSELIGLCDRVPRKPDLEKLLKYVFDCNIQSLFNRIGYLFEKKQNAWDIDDCILRELENKMSKKQTDWPISLEPSLYLNQNYQKNRFAAANMTYITKNRWKINFLNKGFDA